MTWLQPFGPLASNGASIGIDLGTREIKMIVVRTAGEDVFVRDAISIPVEPGSIVDGVVKEPRIVGRMIREKLANRGVTATRTSFSVPTGSNSLYVLDLPALSAGDRRSAARMKLRKSQTFCVEDAYIDVEQGPSKTGKSALGSQIVAAPKEVVNSRAETILHAGLEPVAAELEIHAILRMLDRQQSERSSMWRNGSITIVDLGGVTTQIYVVQNDRIQFTRGIRFGTRRVVAAIVEGGDYSPAQAEELLSDPDTFVDAEGTLFLRQADEVPRKITQGAFDGLVREFVRLQRYLTSLHVEKSYAGILDRAILCGGIVGMAGLTDYLSARLRMEMVLARPFRGVLTEIDGQALIQLSTRENAFVVSLGLAFGDRIHTKRNARGGVSK